MQQDPSLKLSGNNASGRHLDIKRGKKKVEFITDRKNAPVHAKYTQ